MKNNTDSTSLAMKIGKTKRRWAVAAAAMMLASAGQTAVQDLPWTNTAAAEFHGSVNQLGRVFGAGWGDGYHACESSGFRLGADLPPRSYSQRNRQAGSVRQVARTFYDRFDAGRPRQNHSGCDVAAGCDSPAIVIDGSQVIQQPRVWPAPKPAAPATSIESDDSVSPLPLSSATIQPDGQPAKPRVADAEPVVAESSRILRRWPIRPAEPVKQPTSAEPAQVPQPASTDSYAPVAKLQKIPMEMEKTPIPQPSATPRVIVPQHPGNNYANRTQRLIREALGDNFVMPAAPAPTKVAVADVTDDHQAETSFPDSPPTAVDEPKELNAPAELAQAESVAVIVETPQPAAPPAAASPRRLPAPLPQVVATTKKRPTRLGSSSAVRPQPLRLGSAVPPRPRPIRISEPPIRSNPLVTPRAVLELAERPPGPDTAVIQQPR